MENLQKQVQRWKIIAFAGLAFGGGMFVQQYGNASAQRGAAAQVVRLDTSNCTFGVVTGSSPRQVPNGALLMQAVQQGSSAANTAWIYNVCR
ncbi:hypothetical protein [Deinococcus planocerae]|uniref:hypothetical protein n=1 Tax=Deinococcus planocerae TaxID=1737569 RepID=UPI000C7F29B6|nr:hypothetical protein [Deinococcus planocerae]